VSRSESHNFLNLNKEQSGPLSKVQAYLIATKTCIGLLREVCVEFKDLLVILTVIVFFIIGVREAILKLLF
jgi:hypothetical protein